MPMFCVVYGCSNRSNREREKGFYRVPKIVVHKGEKCTNLTTKRRKKWISNLCLRSGGAESPSRLGDVESVDWAPTVNLGYQKTKPKSVAFLQREQRKKFKENQQRWSGLTKLDLQQTVESPDLEQTDEGSEPKQPAAGDGGYADTGCQTDLTMDDIKKMEDVLRDNQHVLIPGHQKLQLGTNRQYVTLQVPLSVTSQIHGYYG